MSTNALGKRYERLLFFAAPLSIACLLVLFVAVGSDQQEERRKARCLRVASNAIENNSSELSKSFKKQEADIRGMKTDSYALSLRYVLIPEEIDYRCETFFSIGDDSAKEWVAREPSKLVSWLRDQVKSLESRPLNLYGIEMPEKATLSFFGTSVKMELTTLVRVLQLALAPMLVLWLGSLYNTRQRETLFNSRIVDLRMLYPHIVNIYPVYSRNKDEGHPSLRKKDWVRYYAERYAGGVIYVIIRMAILAVFVVPPVGAYIISLFYVDAAGFSVFYLLSGFLVAWYGIINFFLELMPWHMNRSFVVIN